MRKKLLLISIMGLLATTGCTSGNDEYSARGDNLGGQEGRQEDDEQCEADEDRDGACVPEDCDDANAEVGPDAAEVPGDGLDNDCDGQVDEGDAPELDCQVDADCPRGEICSQGTCEGIRDEPNCQSDADCPDGEFCDDGQCVTWHAEECALDSDCPHGERCVNSMCEGDGCEDADGDGVCAEQDCNDMNADIHPHAPEVRDGIDNDCDGQVDEGLDEHACESDADCRGGACLDGVCVRDIPECEDNDADGFCVEDGDCDDDNPQVHPDAQEHRDGLDNDCDGSVDEEDGLACAADSDCPRGQVCLDGTCERR